MPPTPANHQLLPTLKQAPRPFQLSAPLDDGIPSCGNPGVPVVLEATREALALCLYFIQVSATFPDSLHFPGTLLGGGMQK